jgi:ParB/RepB/Spo0J family partition protein
VTVAKAKSKPASEPAGGSADVRTPESDPGASKIGNVGLDQIRPSPLNPRKTFAADSVAALADSIEQQGLLQPLVVRPMGAGKPAAFDGRQWKHLSHFELLAGERRFRALNLLAESDRLPSDRVPVTVRWLSDAEALAVMLVENDQREDVRPSEQAAGYKKLLDELGTLPAVSERTGKSMGFVRQVLALGKLPAWALVSVDAGLLRRETAALVARVPGERSRTLAAACVLQGQHNPAWLVGTPEQPDLTGDNLNPLTSREAKELIRTHFQVELKGAPFDRKALYVLPGNEQHSPPCEVCPSRAGNDPQATAEGVRGDVCLDPECFRAKCGVHRAKVLSKYAKDGIEPADLDRPWSEARPASGWEDVRVTAGASFQLRAEVLPKHHDRVLSELLSAPGCAGMAPEYVALNEKGKPVVLVKTADARKALRTVGVIPKEKPKAKAAAKGDADLKRIEPVSLVKYRVTLNAAALATITAEFEAPADRDPGDWYVRDAAIDAICDALDRHWESTPAALSVCKIETPAEAKADDECPVPVGSVVRTSYGTLLADVPDFPAAARERLLLTHAVQYVEQITAKLAEIKAEKGRQNATIFDALKAFGLTPDIELYPAGDALVDHLDPITMPLDKVKDEPKPAKKAKVAK